ncbi:MAG: AMP-dependent synthetase and ligase [Myxococcaceae bacterium]|nr:AMP-dependent synthetase and ligase [Myxococcaceae bacterium]
MSGELDLWGLSQRGDALALLDAASGETLSYGALAARVAALAEQLSCRAGDGRARRGLVFVAAGVEVGTIIAYLAALAAGHAVFLCDRAAHASLHDDLRARYRPDFVLSAEGHAVAIEPHAGDAARSLHPSLAVLLSTSGTTGSPKLVRLSHENLLANARSIASYLELGPDERAISSLPFHYSYGLSVLNSHLYAGGSLVVSDASVMRPELWQAMREHACTSFAGVPYAYQIMRRVGFEKLELPALRTLTQAGGKLPASLIAHYHQLMQARGGRFFAMYGQTEATARMSYLPPAQLPAHAGSIGIAIPEGSLHVLDLSEGRELVEHGATGELVYRGPNVMLGYATSGDDLALGDTQHGELRTGDLGHRDASGLFYVTGRLKRFAKVYGLRINLDAVEDKLRQHGPAAVISDDERLTLYCEFGDEAFYETLKRELATLYQLNVNTFRFRRIEALPLLASGKMDYDALQRRPG